MNIVIAGAGKVGFSLAKVLSIAHNVTIIDKNAEALYTIQEDLDILTIQGESENPNTFKDIKHHIDLFISVTNDDNTNLISSFVAGTVLGIDRKFVRLRNHYHNTEELMDRLGINKMIFPIELASEAILSLLSYPKANNVKFFKYTDYELISVMVSNQFTPTVFSQPRLKIIGIDRGKSFFVPNDNDIEILPNDLVYFFGAVDEIKTECKGMDSSGDIERCIVYGAGDLGIAISKKLANAGCKVKLIEKDIDLCNKADEQLEGKVSIIHTKYSSHEIIKDESLQSADIFIASTSNDEFNIIKSLEAKEIGIKKVVAVNNDMEYYSLMHSLGIVVVRGPKISAYNSIIEEVNSTKLVIQKNFCGAKAIVYMRKIFKNSMLIDKQVKPTKLKNASIFYIRDEIIYLFNEKLVLQEDDLIVSFCEAKSSLGVRTWLYEL